MSLSATITDVCRAYFGRYRGAGRWSPPNRCDKCPLRTPCVEFGRAPARSFAELDEARETFAVAATRLLAEFPR